MPRRETEARMLPNEQQMAIVCRAMPRIIRRVVPQQVQLMRQESPDSRGHLGERTGEIASILDGFEQDGHRMAIHCPITGIDDGAFGRR